MFVVVVVWFCCSSWLAFLILTYYSNLMHQFLLHWVICFGGYLIVHTEFFEKDLDFFGIRKKFFLCFSICSSFGRQLCQNCAWAGSEPYVPSHITEPPCLLYYNSIFRLIMLQYFSVPVCLNCTLLHFAIPQVQLTTLLISLVIWKKNSTSFELFAFLNPKWDKFCVNYLIFSLIFSLYWQ